MAHRWYPNIQPMSQTTQVLSNVALEYQGLMHEIVTSLGLQKCEHCNTFHAAPPLSLGALANLGSEAMSVLCGASDGPKNDVVQK